MTNIESYYNAKFIVNTDLNLYNDYIKNYLIKNKKLDLISNDSAISVINPYSLIHKKNQKFIRNNSQNNYLNNNYLKNNIYYFESPSFAEGTNHLTLNLAGQPDIKTKNKIKLNYKGYDAKLYWASINSNLNDLIVNNLLLKKLILSKFKNDN